MSWMPGGRSGPPPKEVRRTSDVEPGYRPTRWELRDFAASFGLLSLAFAILFAGGGEGLVEAAVDSPAVVALLFLVSFLTAGVGFVVHELAHRFVATRFGRVAAFRAHYGLLALAIVTATVGFIFAAPGGVYVRREISRREHGLIALAGPVSNLLLGAIFGAIWVVGTSIDPEGFVRIGNTLLLYGRLVELVGRLGLAVNFFLAGFNMLPLGPLDGARVYMWNTRVYALVVVPSVALGAVAYLVIGF